MKLLFAGQNFNFMQDIIEKFRQDPRYDVRLDRWNGHDRHDEALSTALLQWADVIITNWLLGNAVWYSQHKKPHQLLITRYHRFEIETEFPDKLHVDNIDAIVSASSIFQPQIEQKLQLPKEKSAFIYNPIDCDKLQLAKQPGSEFHLGLLGYNRKLKGLHRAIDIWEQLAAIDERYRLYVKGMPPQQIGWVWRTPEENEYFTEQYARIERSPYRERVIFEPFGEDVPVWLSKIGYILSMSDFESFHCAAAEGMASGSIPIIRNWVGSESIYPLEYIFADTQDMVDAVLRWNETPDIRASKQTEVQQYSRERFDTDKIFRRFAELIDQLRGA